MLCLSRLSLPCRSACAMDAHRLLSYLLRLAILCLLRTVPGPGGFGCHFGIKCSSFSKMNVGTSQRSTCSSTGFSEYKSVQVGNQLLERSWVFKTMLLTTISFAGNLGTGKMFSIPWRSCCLVLLATALGGAWSVEQPSGSLLQFYPAWRETLQSIFQSGGAHAVGVLVHTSSWGTIIGGWDHEENNNHMYNKTNSLQYATCHMSFEQFLCRKSDP